MTPPEKIILISSRFAIEPWDPWNTLQIAIGMIQNKKFKIQKSLNSTRLHKSRSSRSELEFDLSNFVYGY